MLAEITDGNGRQQILELLGAEDMEGLREQVSALWNANYCRDGRVTSVLASSLWLDKTVSFVPSALDILAKQYYASSYKGEMGSEGFNEALRAWLNEQTGGLLKEQVSGVEMPPSTVIALASTVYYQARWQKEFSESRTARGLFHSKGGDLDCEFMYQSGSRNYYWGETFSALNQSLKGSGSMWFFLPDESVSVGSLLGQDEVMDLIFSGEAWENKKYITVNLTVPKFDVSSDLDLKEGLKAMGVTDVFCADTADFSPLTETEGIEISQIRHGARVMIDEEGCQAAAYTEMSAAGDGLPPEEQVDFVLDRPFLFIITGEDGLPLFMGIVNQP